MSLLPESEGLRCMWRAGMSSSSTSVFFPRMNFPVKRSAIRRKAKGSTNSQVHSRSASVLTLTAMPLSMSFANLAGSMSWPITCVASHSPQRFMGSIQLSGTSNLRNFFMCADHVHRVVEEEPGEAGRQEHRCTVELARADGGERPRRGVDREVFVVAGGQAGADEREQSIIKRASRLMSRSISQRFHFVLMKWRVTRPVMAKVMTKMKAVSRRSRSLSRVESARAAKG